MVVDAFVAVSASPVTAGPVRIMDNIFINSPSGQYSNFLKILSGPTKGADVQGNVFVGSGVFFNNKKSPITNSIFKNNFFLSRAGLRGLAWPESVGPDPGQVILVPPHRWPDLQQGPRALSPSIPVPAALSLQHLGPQWLDPGRDPATTEISLLLRAGWLTR